MRSRRTWKSAVSDAGTAAQREEGQSLIIVVVAMFAVLAMAAFAIDVASWYQKHHQAQVAADSAALAAANYMASGGAAASATSTATTYASNNGRFTVPAGNVTVDTTSNTVTVLVPSNGANLFQHMLGSGPSISARAVASWNTSSNAQYSLFAANPTCGSGLGLDFTSNGGGHESVSGIYSNGQFEVDANSDHPVDGAFAAPGCSGNTTSVKDGTVTQKSGGALPYPTTYSYPSTCDHSQSYFTTSSAIGKTSVPAANQITSPGVYCVTSSFNDSGGCTDDYQNLNKTGWLYVDASKLSGTGYEFVGPCLSLLNLTSNITAPSGAPLVYGTSNITTAATTTSLPTCTSSSNNNTTTWLDNNGASLASTIFDQCGTVEVTGNNTFTGFIEAYNIKVDKNNSVTGTGPTEPFLSGGDSLIS